MRAQLPTIESLAWLRDLRGGDGPMTTGRAPMCLECARFRPKAPGLTCDAFPKGIPEAIYLNQADHREPYPGDGGKRFVPKDPDRRRRGLEQPVPPRAMTMSARWRPWCRGEGGKEGLWSPSAED